MFGKIKKFIADCKNSYIELLVIDRHVLELHLDTIINKQDMTMEDIKFITLAMDKLQRITKTINKLRS